MLQTATKTNNHARRILTLFIDNAGSGVTEYNKIKGLISRQGHSKLSTLCWGYVGHFPLPNSASALPRFAGPENYTMIRCWDLDSKIGALSSWDSAFVARLNCFGGSFATRNHIRIHARICTSQPRLWKSHSRVQSHVFYIKSPLIAAGVNQAASSSGGQTKRSCSSKSQRSVWKEYFC